MKILQQKEFDTYLATSNSKVEFIRIIYGLMSQGKIEVHYLQNYFSVIVMTSLN
jgi:hypothetical protein